MLQIIQRKRVYNGNVFHSLDDITENEHHPLMSSSERLTQTPISMTHLVDLRLSVLKYIWLQEEL